MTTEQIATAALERVPWDRVDGESTQAFARFTAYRLLPPGQRSLAKVGVNVVMAAKWSRKYGWVQRANAWDDWLLTNGDALGIHASIKARIRHAELGQAIARHAIKCLPKVKVSTAEALVELAESAVKIERAALGLDTKIQDDGPALQVQILNVGSDSTLNTIPARPRKTYEEISGTRIGKKRDSKGELINDKPVEQP